MNINTYQDLIKKLNTCKTVGEALKIAEAYEIREELIIARIAIMHANTVYHSNMNKRIKYE